MMTYCPTCRALRYFTQLLPQCKPEAVPFDGTFPMWEAS